MFKQLQTKFLALLAIMLMGGSSAWADDVVYKAALFGSAYNSKGVSGYTDTWTATNGDFTVSLTNFNNNNNGWNYVKCGRKNTASVATIITAAAIDKAITKVAVTIDAITASKVNSIKLYTSSNGTSWTEAGSYTKDTGAQTVTLASPAANLYYKVEFDCASGSSNGLVTVSKVEYYSNEGGDTPTPTVAAPTFSLDAGIYNTAQSVTITTATAGATIYYTTNGDVPTTSSNEYASAIEVASTMTIKAIAVKDGESSAVAEATYTIVNIEHAGTEADPYTVADARAAIDANAGIEDVYATGIVSKIVTAYNSQYGNITYNISADGTTTADQLEAYRGKSYNGDNFTSEADIQVGDVVVVYGTLQKYGNTYEFAQGNKLVSLQRPVITTPSISLSETTIDATADGAEGTIDVTYNNITDVVAEVKFYEADGETTASYDWVTAVVNEDNDVDYIIEANTGEARTAYMKVYALDDEANDVYSELITISQAAYGAPVIPTGNSYVKVTSTDDITTGQYLIVYEGNDTHSAVAFNGGLETLDAANNTIAITIENNEIEVTDATEAAEFTIDLTAGTIKSASGLYIGKTAYSNGLDSNANTQYTNSFAITDGSAVITASGDCILRYNYASDQARFRYYKSGQQAIQLYKKFVTLPAATATIAEACTDGTKYYGTYSNTSAFILPEGVTASEISVIDGELVVEDYAAGATVPANTGVMISSATAGEKTFYLTTGGESVLGEDNMLRPTGAGVTADEMAAEDPACLYYRLTMHNGETIGFWWGAAEGAAFNVAANKAYLAVPAAETGTGSKIQGFTFDNGGDATEIVLNALKGEQNGETYNLQGQKVGSEYKGIVIVNGKKVMVK